MILGNKSFSLSLIATYVLGIILLVFTFAKASITAFTYDEAFTFIHYLPQDYMRIFSFAAPYAANNHILSSMLMKLSMNLFGSSELALRVPSLMAHAGYIFLSISILRKFNPVLLLPGFILLNANPYALDFFALGRGYALATCLMMGSVFYWIKFRESQDNRKYIYSLVLAGAAAFSNFSLLLFVASLLVLHNFIGLLNGMIITVTLKESVKKLMKWNKINFIFLFGLLIIFYEPIRRCIKFKLFYHGGVTGFWRDSIVSITEYSLYDASYAEWLILPLLGCLAAVLLISAVLFIRLSWVSFTDQNSAPIWKMDFIVLFIFTFVISTVLNWLIGNYYPIDRATLFLFPLIILILLSLIEYIMDTTRYRKVTIAITFALGFSFAVHAGYTQNLKDCIHWRHDSQTPVMMAELGEYAQGYSKEKPMFLGIEWIYYPVVNYHIIADKMDWVDQVGTRGITGKEDMIYLSQSDTLKYVQSGFQVVKLYPITSTALMGRASETH